MATTNDLESFAWESVQPTLCTGIRTVINNIRTFDVHAITEDPSLLLMYYRETDPLVIAIVFMAMLAVIHTVTAELTRNYSQVGELLARRLVVVESDSVEGHIDKAWSILPPIYAWHFAIHDYLNRTFFHPRLLLCAILITLWGIRLTYNFARYGMNDPTVCDIWLNSYYYCFLFRKGGYEWSGRDYRFVYIHEKIGQVAMSLLNLTFIGPFQNILLLMMTLPLYLSTLATGATGLNRIDVVASVLFLALLLLEMVADDQQFVFQTKKYALLDFVVDRERLTGDYKRGFLCSSGLWQYSRHPNFFSEISIWWTVYLFSVAAYVGAGSVKWTDCINWTIGGAVVLTMLFQGSTWLTEVTKELVVCLYLHELKSVAYTVYLC